MKLKNKTGATKLVIPAVILIVIVLGVLIFSMVTNSDKKSVILKTEDIDYEYFVLYSSDDEAGIVDKNGNIIIEPTYTEIYVPNQSKDVFFCYSSSEDYVILNKAGEEILTDFAEVMFLETSEATELIFEKDVLRYKEDGLYGLINLEGEIVTEAVYDKVSSLTNKPGNILVKQDGYYGVIDSSGNEIIPIKYDSITGDEYCQEEYGYALTGYVVSIKTDTGVMYGYIDYAGNEMLKTEYEIISRVLEYDDINNIYLVVRSNGKRGVFKNGKQIIDFNYQAINYSDSSNVFIVQKNGKYGFYNNSGEEILPAKYTSYDIAGNYISVSNSDGSMLYDLNGNLINKDTYSSMIEVEDSSYFIAVKEDGYYSIISKDEQIEGSYIYISYAFDDNFIFINEEGNSGVINIKDEIVIEPTYSSILNIENTKVLEARNDETGYVDIYNSNFEKVSTISEGVVEKVGENYVVVYSDSEMVYFNSEGDIVSNTEVYANKLYAIEQDGKWGFADEEGNIVVECVYDIVSELNEYGFAAVKLDGLWGVVSENGEVIAEPSYEIETYYFPSFVGKYLLEYMDTLHCTEI